MRTLALLFAVATTGCAAPAPVSEAELVGRWVSPQGSVLELTADRRMTFRNLPLRYFDATLDGGKASGSGSWRLPDPQRPQQGVLEVRMTIEKADRPEALGETFFFYDLRSERGVFFWTAGVEGERVGFKRQVTAAR